MLLVGAERERAYLRDIYVTSHRINIIMHFPIIGKKMRTFKRAHHPSTPSWSTLSASRAAASRRSTQRAGYPRPGTSQLGSQLPQKAMIEQTSCAETSNEPVPALTLLSHDIVQTAKQRQRTKRSQRGHGPQAPTRPHRGPPLNGRIHRGCLRKKLVQSPGSLLWRNTG